MKGIDVVVLRTLQAIGITAVPSIAVWVWTNHNRTGSGGELPRTNEQLRKEFVTAAHTERILIQACFCRVCIVIARSCILAQIVHIPQSILIVVNGAEDAENGQNIGDADGIILLEIGIPFAVGLRSSEVRHEYQSPHGEGQAATGEVEFAHTGKVRQFGRRNARRLSCGGSPLTHAYSFSFIQTRGRLRQLSSTRTATPDLRRVVQVGRGHRLDRLRLVDPSP